MQPLPGAAYSILLISECLQEKFCWYGKAGKFVPA
jgi:hypothetical protein